VSQTRKFARGMGVLGAGLIVLAGLAGPLGCTLFRARADIKAISAATTLRGVVTSSSPEPRTIIVALLEEEGDHKALVSYFVHHGSGPFEFLTPPKTGFIFAFEDTNDDLRYQKGDPAAWYGGMSARPITMIPGGVMDGLDIELGSAVPSGVGEIAELVSRRRESDPELAYFRRGAVEELSDPRFGPETGPLGLWEPVRFVTTNGMGLFFLEEFDAARIPVLFVHGAGGYPQEFDYLIAGLDRRRFQPWVYQYPSGLRLRLAGKALLSALDEVRAHHRFDVVCVVAHSMGGLVARSAINDMVQRDAGAYVGLFVSISTPWGGHAAAAAGVRHSPVVVPSWVDMAEGSPFLTSLLAASPPPDIPHHLYFSYRGGRGTDGTVSLRSQLDPRVQLGAARVFGFDEDHVSVLGSAAVRDALNQALDTVTPKH
jgi:hypothetical protein